jgi:ribosomal protein S18 acetylase RimI-like enzyme
MVAMSAPVAIRPFVRADEAACLRIFDGNLPRFFAPSERPEFVRFLETSTSPYLVATAQDGIAIGCGGYAVDSDAGFASLTWGMVQRSWHGRGIGEMLLRARIAAIEASTTVAVIRATTSQHVQGFFERHGFKLVRIDPDGLAQGLDRVEMERPVSRSTA